MSKQNYTGFVPMVHFLWQTNCVILQDPMLIKNQQQIAKNLQELYNF
jgi:hypothetical protein